jgi:hypothetical protein
MNAWRRFVILGMCIVAATVILAGCRKHKHDKVQVIEEQRHGEIREVPPGEMTPEEP